MGEQPQFLLRTNQNKIISQSGDNHQVNNQQTSGHLSNEHITWSIQKHNGSFDDDL